MKSLFIAVACVALSFGASRAATISIGGSFAFNVTSFSGGDLAAGSLALIVVDTGSNGFLQSSILAGNSLTVGSFLSGDDLIVGSFGATNSGQANFDTILTGAVSFDPEDGFAVAADPGDQFAIIWFDGATASTATAAVGQYYQIGRASDWIVPTSPDSITAGTDFTFLGTTSGGSAGQATIAVSAVPEPGVSVLAMAGAMFAVLGRRRRQNRYP